MTFNRLSGALFLTLASTSTLAADINFSGYGTVRGGLVLDDDKLAPNYGYGSDLDFKNESKFALQAISKFNKQWSATIVLHAAGENDFDIAARWAYLSYQLSPETTVTLGRFALPYFRNSDTQDIGYSHNYGRMPKSVYEGQEFDLIEGVRVSHSTYIGDADLTIKGSFGAFSGEAETSLGAVDTKINNILQLSVDYSYEWFSFYLGAVNAEVSLDINQEVNGILMQSLPGYTVNANTAYNPANVAVYDMRDLYADEDNALYVSTGITAEHENWLFNAEYASYNVDDSFFEESNVFYVAVSYSFDDFIVSLVHEDISYSFDYEHAKASDPYVNGFVSSVSDAFFKPQEYDAKGIHFRYDAAPGVAYKADYTRSTGQLSGDSTGIVSFGVDFVF